MRTTITLLTICTSVLLGSCSGCGAKGGPIDSLSAESPSSEYDARYWQAEAEDDSQTWQKAVEFCRENAAQAPPNCAVVLKVGFIHGMDKAFGGPLPESGDDGGSTGVPEALMENLDEPPPDDKEKDESDP